MLGLVGIAFGMTAADIGGDIAAIGPYVVSHIGLPLAMVILYVLVDPRRLLFDDRRRERGTVLGGRGRHRQTLLAGDHEGPLFVITKISMLLGGLIATLIVLSGVDFTTLVLTTYALKTSILLPLVLAILWPRTNTVGFVGGVVLAILIGMTIYETQGELIGTLSIVAISGITVVIAGYAGSARFDIASLRRVGDDIASEAPAAIAQPAE